MKIGNVKINNNLILAPMTKINDLPFRMLCKKNGAGLVYTEMINSNAITRNNKSAIRMAKTIEEEKPVAIQIFGARKDLISEAAKILEPNADILDFNLGCPAIKVIRIGAGAALLDKPKKVKEILTSLVNSVKIPVIVKIRLGFRKINALEIAKIAEASGVSAITVHARTYKQGYSGKADLSYIKEIKENVSIPVIGNGDVNNKESYEEMLKISDAVMIGRAAMHNPGIFKEILHNKVIPKQELFLRYCELAKKYDLENFQRTLIHAINFSSGMKDAVSLRTKINKCRTIEELKNVF